MSEMAMTELETGNADGAGEIPVVEVAKKIVKKKKKIVKKKKKSPEKKEPEPEPEPVEEYIPCHPVYDWKLFDDPDPSLFEHWESSDSEDEDESDSGDGESLMTLQFCLKIKICSPEGSLF